MWFLKKIRRGGKAPIFYKKYFPFINVLYIYPEKELNTTELQTRTLICYTFKYETNWNYNCFFSIKKIDFQCSNKIKIGKSHYKIYRFTDGYNFYVKQSFLKRVKDFISKMYKNCEDSFNVKKKD